MLGRLARMPHVQARLPNNISCQPTLRLHQNRARRIGYNCVLNSQTEGYHFPHDIEKKREKTTCNNGGTAGAGWRVEPMVVSAYAWLVRQQQRNGRRTVEKEGQEMER